MKTALVTGTGRGLGKGFVDYLLSEGYMVFAGTRNLDSPKYNNSNLKPILLDVSSDEQIKSAFEEIKKQTDSLDLIINNAGLSKRSAGETKGQVDKLTELDRSTLLRIFDVNTISPILITKYFLPLLTGNPSFVINISSSRASYNDEHESSSANYGYRSSKAALNMMTHSLVHDLPDNIQTFTVHPGSVKTDMNNTGPMNPIEAATKIIEITKNWKKELNGKYLKNDGTLYPL